MPSDPGRGRRNGWKTPFIQVLENCSLEDVVHRPWYALRRGLGRFVDATGAPRRAAAHAAASSVPLTVPLTVRGVTRDEADVRLLLEAVTVPAGDAASPAWLGRVVDAIVVPAAGRWLGDHALADLDDPVPLRVALEERVVPELTGLGVLLLRCDVVAVEHLVVSPSAEPARPSRSTPNGEPNHDGSR